MGRGGQAGHLSLSASGRTRQPFWPQSHSLMPARHTKRPGRAAATGMQLRGGQHPQPLQLDPSNADAPVTTATFPVRSAPRRASIAVVR